MFNIPRPFGYSRRQLPGRFEFYRSRADWPEGRTIWGMNWREQMKLAPERRPHPAYLNWRDVHPCYYYRLWECGHVRVLKEAWIVKIERNSPRAMKSLSHQQTEKQWADAKLGILTP